MMRELNIVVSAPCSMSWAAMAGDDRVRHCGGCSQNVYNISDMTQKEAELFLQENGTGNCMQFYRRADGTIMTDNCPVGLRALRNRCRSALRVAAAAVASLLAFVPFVKSDAQQQTSSAGPKAGQTADISAGQIGDQSTGQSASAPTAVEVKPWKEAIGAKVGENMRLGYIHRLPETKSAAKQVMLGSECSDSQVMNQAHLPQFFRGRIKAVQTLSPCAAGNANSVPADAPASTADAFSNKDAASKPGPADFTASDLYSKARVSEEQNKTILALFQMRQAYKAWKEQKGADPAFGAHIEAEVLRLELKMKLHE